MHVRCGPNRKQAKAGVDSVCGMDHGNLNLRFLLVLLSVVSLLSFSSQAAAQAAAGKVKIGSVSSEVVDSGWLMVDRRI
jgi:hypothetical protein